MENLKSQLIEENKVLKKAFVQEQLDRYQMYEKVYAPDHLKSDTYPNIEESKNGTYLFYMKKYPEIDDQSLDVFYTLFLERLTLKTKDTDKSMRYQRLASLIGLLIFIVFGTSSIIALSLNPLIGLVSVFATCIYGALFFILSQIIKNQI